MITKPQVESILRINGVSSTVSDEEVKTIMMNARYTDKQADEAIRLIRTKSNGANFSNVDGLHKVFRTGEALMPKEISNLLGVDVEVTGDEKPRYRSRGLTAPQLLLAIIFSLIVCGCVAVYYMYLSQTGIFHPIIAM